MWFAFLPTVIVPWFISHWLLIGALKKADRFLPPYVNNAHQSETRRHSVLPRHPAAANASAQWSIGRKIKRYTLHCTALWFLTLFPQGKDFLITMIVYHMTGMPRRIWARQGPIFYPIFFDWLFLMRAYWNPKSRQGPGAPWGPCQPWRPCMTKPGGNRVNSTISHLANQTVFNNKLF